MTDHQCVGVDAGRQRRDGSFSGNVVRAARSRRVRAGVVIACDGINSAIRKHFYPDDAVAFSGINTWRGVTRRKPILDGRTYLRIGSILTGKIVIYPIIDDVDGDGQPADQLDGRDQAGHVRRRTTGTSPADLDDFFPHLCRTGGSTGSTSPA